MGKFKVLSLIICIIIFIFVFSSCGNQIILDTTYKFDYALVQFPDGQSEKIELKGWTDFEDGDQLQIMDINGNVYLVHSVNCILVKESN